MTDSEKFTVIVPTRQRADVLGPALETIVTQDYDNLRILVSDNFSNDTTRDVVESFNDPRIAYHNTGKRLSMSHNWEFALSHISDGWIAIVGDDDGLLPGSLARVSEIAREYGVKAIGSRNAAYTWPCIPEQPFGKISVSLKSGVSLHDSKKCLSSTCHGHTAYSSLPMLYTGGFIHSNLVEQARNASGVFYHSMNPDIYSAVIFTKLTDRFAFSNEPLAIGGSSRHSTGTSSFSAAPRENPADTPASKFFSEPNIPFHEKLLTSDHGMPPPSIELFVYESLLQSEHLPPSCTTLTDHAGQLAIILGRAKRRHRKDLSDWAQMFAQRHDLDMAAISKKARAIRVRLKLNKSLRKLTEKLDTVNISGNSDLPIRNVYDASLVVSTVLNQR